MPKKIEYEVEHYYKVRVQVYAVDTSVFSCCIEFRSDIPGYEPFFWLFYNNMLRGRFASFEDALLELHKINKDFRWRAFNEFRE